MPDERTPSAAGAVRKGTELDAPQIARLYAMLVSNSAVHVLPDRLAEIASDPDTALFIFEDGESVLGTVMVSLCADVMFGRRPFAVVENIVVDKSARGLRIGERLPQAAEAFCTAADCSRIMPLSAASRRRAHTFFERCGYSDSTNRGFVKYRTAFGMKDWQMLAPCRWSATGRRPRRSAWRLADDATTVPPGSTRDALLEE